MKRANNIKIAEEVEDNQLNRIIALAVEMDQYELLEYVSSIAG